ncbi:glycosyltransferase [bacterium]|nr:glycosyltransferase [bacterium]
MELSILLPVRNEGLNLKIMLKILRSVVETEHEVLVIVDDANDASIPVLESVQAAYGQCRLVLNDRGRGVLNAIRAGVASSRGKYVLIFAADEVGPVLALDEMLALMREGCDFVSCTRYAHGGRRLGGSLVGGLLSRLACRLFRLVGGAFTDSTTGIKMFRREVFERLQLESTVGWSIAFEMSIKAQLHGLVLGEVPIVSIDRLYGGKSTFRLGPWIVAYARLFLRGLGERRKLRASRSAVRVRIPSFAAPLASLPPPPGRASPPEACLEKPKVVDSLPAERPVHDETH